MKRMNKGILYLYRTQDHSLGVISTRLLAATDGSCVCAGQGEEDETEWGRG